MDQAPRYAPLDAAMIRRAPPRVTRAPTDLDADGVRTELRDDLRFFVHAYVAALIVFLTWLA